MDIFLFTKIQSKKALMSKLVGHKQPINNSFLKVFVYAHILKYDLWVFNWIYSSLFKFPLKSNINFTCVY